MDSTGEKSSLTCPKCGSKNTKIIDLTILVPVLKCSDCGTEWMPAPEGIGAGLAGNHPRDFESEGNTEKKPMGVFRTTLLLLIMLVIILGVVIIIFGFP